jgi:hypothetical protein
MPATECFAERFETKRKIMGWDLKYRSEKDIIEFCAEEKPMNLTKEP